MTTDMLTGADFDNVIDAGYYLGWTDCRVQYDIETQLWLGVYRQVLSQPRMDELKAARTVDHQPCGLRCRKCSRCICSLAYWARGGRDYLGVDDVVDQQRIAESWAARVKKVHTSPLSRAS